MVKSIQELYRKIERREKKRLQDGKDIVGVHVHLVNALYDINSQSSYVYRDYLRAQKELCLGFLYGLRCSRYITEEEFKILENELTSAYKAYFHRSLRGDVAL
ncbi:MAG: hypothetical protein K2N98_00770 [Lachnospiraceae bacterium]|nr:hypothetical protein [Lachnospiraceae bacterium]